MLEDNTRICTGAIVNNTRLDYSPYMLTAFHCIDGGAQDRVLSPSEIADAEQWIVMFNYESVTCSNADGPTNQTISGTNFKAAYYASDFALLELSSGPPASYGVYYAGWTNVNTPSQSSVGIHHPQGDIKKISIDNDAVTSTGYITFGYPINSHWRVAEWDDGTTEDGSSGSPLFDRSHRIVGQLHGGTASCSSPTLSDYYGKFSVSWDFGGSSATQLKDWLDPDNSGAETLGGMVGPPRVVNITLPNATISKARVYDAGGSVTAGTGVTINSSGDVTFVAGGYAGGDVTLSAGFHAQAGSRFRAYIDPDIIPPPPPPPTTLVIWNEYEDYENPYLIWDAPVTATSYKVYRQYDGAAFSLIASPTTNSYTDATAELESASSKDIGYYVTALNYWGESGASPTASAAGYLTKKKPGLPTVYALHPAYPNPFNPTTTFRYDLPKPTEVRLIVYNLLGREVVRLVNAHMDAGYQAALWHGRDAGGRQVPSGMYIARLVTPKYTKSIKMVLLK